MNNQFIVKVQLPIMGDMSNALIYDRKKKIMTHVPITKPIRIAMDGNLKAYFHAELKGDKVELISKAPWQEW